jgi:hypothetical protein
LPRPKLGRGSYFPAFLEARRTSDAELIAVKRTCRCVSAGFVARTMPVEIHHVSDTAPGESPRRCGAAVTRFGPGPPPVETVDNGDRNANVGAPGAVDGSGSCGPIRPLTCFVHHELGRSSHDPRRHHSMHKGHIIYPIYVPLIPIQFLDSLVGNT